MARPKLSEEEKKTKKKDFRCSQSEWYLIDQFCQTHNLTVLDLVKLGMGHQQPAAKATTDKKLQFELSKIGNNLNQIALKLNSGNKAARLMASARVAEIEELKTILHSIQNQMR